jgi:hypothetical protein
LWCEKLFWVFICGEGGGRRLRNTKLLGTSIVFIAVLAKICRLVHAHIAHNDLINAFPLPQEGILQTVGEEGNVESEKRV